MIKNLLPTLSWVITNTIIYGGYHFINLGTTLSSFCQQAQLDELKLLYYKPLLWLYLFSTATIIIIGIFDTHARRKEKQKKYERKKNRQRTNYVAQ